MAAAITVPAGFVEDFKFFCERAGLDVNEQHQLRHKVREDFARVGAHITETAAVYRFCDIHWRGLPSADQAQAFCAVFGWKPDDDGMFKRLGPLLLGKLCAQVYGVVPWPTAE